MLEPLTVSTQAKLIESKFVLKLKDYLSSLGCHLIKVSGHGWIPDAAAVWGDLACVFEAKADYAGYSGVRIGLAQALDGFIKGYKSYLVIPVSLLPHTTNFLPYLPQVGVITYSEEVGFSIVVEGLTPNQCNSLALEQLKKIGKIVSKAERYVTNSLTPDKNIKSRQHGSVKVKEFLYMRKGHLIKVKGYSRRKPHYT